MGCVDGRLNMSKRLYTTLINLTTKENTSLRNMSLCPYVILSKDILRVHSVFVKFVVLLYNFTGIAICSSVKSALVACALTLKPNVRFFSLGKL